MNYILASMLECMHNDPNFYLPKQLDKRRMKMYTTTTTTTIFTYTKTNKDSKFCSKSKFINQICMLNTHTHTFARLMWPISSSYSIDKFMLIRNKSKGRERENLDASVFFFHHHHHHQMEYESSHRMENYFRLTKKKKRLK